MLVPLSTAIIFLILLISSPPFNRRMRYQKLIELSKFSKIRQEVLSKELDFKKRKSNVYNLGKQVFYFVSTGVIYKSFENRKRILLYIGFFILFFLNTFRNSTVGTDYKHYINSFEIKEVDNPFSLPTFSNDFLSEDSRENREISWVILNNFVKNNGGSYFTVNLIASLIILVFFYVSIVRESPYPMFSLFLFLMLYIFYQSFNTTRQSISVAIFIFSIYYIYHKKLVYYVLLCILAFSFHTSALFLVPLYFLRNVNFRFELVGILLAISYLIPLLSFDSILLKQLTMDSPYITYFNDVRTYNSNGYVPIFVFLFVQTVFFILTYKHYGKSNIYLNIWFLGLLIQNFTIHYNYLSRFCDYFIASQILAIPIVYASSVNNLNNRYYIILAITYSIFIYAYCLYSNFQGILPYSFNF